MYGLKQLEEEQSLPATLDPVAGIRKACLDSFECFVRYFWSRVPGTEELLWNWHMSVICEELEKVARRVFRNEPREYNLIINISPGTSKSTLCSILFPAWCWANMPRTRIIAASHTDDLVMDLSSKAREVILSEDYQELFPYVELRPDQKAKGNYATTAGGDRYSCTVAGKSPVGRHGHIIIVDDPLDPKKAASEVELQNAKDFFDGVIASRTVNKDVAVMILIMQRLHEDDPTGHMIKKSKREGADAVKHYKLPAEVPLLEDGSYDTSHVLPEEVRRHYLEWNEDAGRMPEGLMDPVRLTRKTLNARRTDSMYVFSGQYLQHPVPLGGGMFKVTYFSKRIKAAPYDCDRVLYCDRASTADGGCATAMTCLARSKDGRYFIEYAVKGHWEPYERNQRIKATALKLRARFGPRYEPEIQIEREGGASGKGDFMDIARELAGFRVREHNIVGMGKKEHRAEPWSSQLAAGNVWVVDNGQSEGTGECDWDIDDYVHEHVLFPKGTYKDQVDASSGAFLVMSSRGESKGVQIYSTSSRQKDLRIYFGDFKALENSQIDDQCLLIILEEPLIAGREVSAPPKHLLTRLMDTLTLHFADIQSSEYQDRWDQPLVGYGGKLPEEVLVTRDDVKRLWAFLTKKRVEPFLSIVIADDGSRKARSVALALCDMYGKKPENTLFDLTQPDSKVGGQPPNKHLADMVRLGRALVV